MILHRDRDRMKYVLKPVLTAAFTLALASCGGGGKPASLQLEERLAASVAEGKILYGHQDDLVYGHAWKVEDVAGDPLERSDVRDVAGRFPAIVGFDLGALELGRENNLDGVPFALMCRAALTHVQRGGIVTFSWHPWNPLTGTDAWGMPAGRAVASVLPGGENHEKFRSWLKAVGDLFDLLRDEEGERIPFIFRPWHEHTGSWFWWGRDHCTTEEYVALFRMTHDYLAVERGMDNIVWCYSPGRESDEAMYMERWPGDDVVDLMGLDCYTYLGADGIEAAVAHYKEQVGSALSYLTRLGREHGKLICLSETGFEGIPDPKWWTETLYPTIKDYPIAYVLTWRNSSEMPGHFYAPWKGFAHEADFKQFSELDKITLL